MAVRFDGPLLHRRWRLGPPLGEGGQGRTFLARDEIDVLEDQPIDPGARVGDVVVVAKELRLAGQKGWKKFDLFEREVRVLRGLDHPGVPRYLDHFESEPPGAFYLIMQRAPGETLKALAARARFTEPALVDVLTRALEILAYLHSRVPPVIHRDVKPANLVRAADKRLALVDFGGVRDALREEGGSTMVGTFGYMAPEQLHGQASAATDVFGLGATIVSLAAGVEPERVPRRGLRMDLRRQLTGLSPWLVELLERMTDPDPDGRPQSAIEVQRLLAAAQAPPRAIVPVTPPAPPAPVVPPAAPVENEDVVSFMADPTVFRPLRVVARLFFMALGLAGAAAMTVLYAGVLPFVFALASVFTPARHRPKLRETRDEARGALLAAREEFRALRRATRPRALPPADNKK